MPPPVFGMHRPHPIPPPASTKHQPVPFVAPGPRGVSDPVIRAPVGCGPTAADAGKNVAVWVRGHYDLMASQVLTGTGWSMASASVGFWLSPWFRTARNVLGVIVLVGGATGAATRLFLYPLALELLTQLAKPGTESYAIQGWAWLFAAGWGMFVCAVLVFICLLFWHRYRLFVGQREMRAQVELGVGCAEVYGFLQDVQTMVKAAMPILEDKHVAYGKFEAVRSAFLKCLQTQMTKISRARRQKRFAFNAIARVERGVSLASQVQGLLALLETEVFHPANQACQAGSEWDARKAAILSGARNLLSKAEYLQAECIDLDPSRAIDVGGRERHEPAKLQEIAMVSTEENTAHGVVE